jgi:hypothetical protein
MDFAVIYICTRGQHLLFDRSGTPATTSNSIEGNVVSREASPDANITRSFADPWWLYGCHVSSA